MGFLKQAGAARCIAALAGLIAVGSAWAGDASVSGYVAGELRAFPSEPLQTGQFETFQPSFLAAPEFRYRSENGNEQFTVIPFLHVDSQDGNRTHFDVREAYWLHRADSWDLTVGLNKVYWGVAESRHLVDVINQADFVEDIDEEDKLGQPMVNLNFQRSWGNISLFLLPGFRERTFSDTDGRPGFPLAIDVDNAVYESGRGRGRVDFAARYSQYFGDWDVGVSYFQGTGREPRFVPSVRGDRLILHYDLIKQGSVDVQYTKNAWLWKFEGIVREGQGSTFGAMVGGFEYTLYQIAGAADLGLLVEYQRDERDAGAPFTLGDDDLFFGARYALNDTQDTSILGGALVDRDTRATAVLIEAERRLSEHWKFEFEGRFFTNTEPRDPLYFFRNDSFVTARLSYFF
jgi:hypothetical protein